MFSGSITAFITPSRMAKVDEASFSASAEWQDRTRTERSAFCGGLTVINRGDPVAYRSMNASFGPCVEAARPVACRSSPGNRALNSNGRGGEPDQKREGQSGADAALIVTPYYNKPSTQDGLYLHYKKIHDLVEIPIIIYNIPGRTGTSI